MLHRYNRLPYDTVGARDRVYSSGEFWRAWLDCPASLGRYYGVIVHGLGDIVLQGLPPVSQSNRLLVQSRSVGYRCGVSLVFCYEGKRRSITLDWYSQHLRRQRLFSGFYSRRPEPSERWETAGTSDLEWIPRPKSISDRAF